MKALPWTDEEIMTIVAAYNRILDQETAGIKVNKALMRRNVLPLLNSRSAGSYEMKMCNISAARVALGYPIINGYKPLGHGQKALERAIMAFNGTDYLRLAA